MFPEGRPRKNPSSGTLQSGGANGSPLRLAIIQTRRCSLNKQVCTKETRNTWHQAHGKEKGQRTKDGEWNDSARVLLHKWHPLTECRDVLMLPCPDFWHRSELDELILPHHLCKRCASALTVVQTSWYHVDAHPLGLGRNPGEVVRLGIENLLNEAIDRRACLATPVALHTEPTI